MGGVDRAALSPRPRTFPAGRQPTLFQVSRVELDDYLRLREQHIDDEWLDLLVQSIGFNPDNFHVRTKWLLMLRLVPFVEPNYNLIELGPRETGKTYTDRNTSYRSFVASGSRPAAAPQPPDRGRVDLEPFRSWRTEPDGGEEDDRRIAEAALSSSDARVDSGARARSLAGHRQRVPPASPRSVSRHAAWRVCGSARGGKRGTVALRRTSPLMTGRHLRPTWLLA